VNAEVDAESISYEESKELARHDDPAVRISLAQRSDLKPEILYYLAEDKDPEVRRMVARNQAAPGQSDLLLATDSDNKVRSHLAGRIAKSSDTLAPDVTNKAKHATYQALEILAQDQIPLVRQVLADAIKDVTNAPADIIKTLAHDTLIEVSGPVLEHSKVLSDDDLIEIVKSSPVEGALNRISKREAVGEKLSDAIVATDDTAAIADLLSNQSAQIREQTLDDLVERAEDVNVWHAPLVARPKLPKGAAMKMAHFLADNLLDVLQERSDLDDSTLAQIKDVVRRRLDRKDIRIEEESEIPKPAQDFLTTPLPIDMVKRLFEGQRLDGKMVERALEAGDHGFVLATLVTRAGIAETVGKRVFKEKSPKGIVALCQMADMPISIVVKVQQRMGRIAPSDVIMPENHEYPMDRDEAAWQLKFYQDLARRSSE